MKNVLVTGGAGFIGSHTAVELHAAGYRPVILDNFSNSKESAVDGIAAITGERSKLYTTDFADVKALEKIINDESIDGVIHFAALKAVGESVEQPLTYYRNNVAGFIGLLELLQESGIPLVFSSSCTVYGEPDTLPVNEQAPFKPAESPYGSSKQMDEIILRDVIRVSTKLKSIALRYFNPIGAHPSGKIGELPLGIPSNLFPFMTQSVAGLRPEMVVYGDDYDTPDGSCVRDYIHVVDLAKAHIKALEHLDKQPAGYFDAFNVGTGTGVSVLEVISAFEKATGKKVPHRIGDRRAGDVVKIYGDPAKAVKVLGWKAECSLEDACRDAWNWQQKL
jgi:UDP-glucose 4-epimerase